jgi:hypothetical protein
VGEVNQEEGVRSRNRSRSNEWEHHSVDCSIEIVREDRVPEDHTKLDHYKEDVHEKYVYYLFDDGM